MAPVVLQPQVRYLPLLAVLSHAAAATYVTFTILATLLSNRNALRPSQNTRSRHGKLHKTVPVFAGLAAVSFLLLGYYGFSSALLSYQVWADEIDVASLSSTLSDRPLASRGIKGLILWLSNTPIYQDAWEIVVEKIRRFWWGQQLDLASVAWGMYVATVGRRRQIPHLWAYVALSQLLSLSFAQSLFYLALLTTPLPLLSSTGKQSLAQKRSLGFIGQFFVPKPSNWMPHRVLHIRLLALSYIAIFVFPYTLGTSLFMPAAFLSKLLPLGPLILATIVPQSWGTTHFALHEEHVKSSRTEFQLISAASLLLHGKVTIEALLYSLPGSYKHRHSIKIPFDVEQRSAWERSTTAIGKILGSSGDHPVVAAASCDVLLSAIGLGLWAAVRATDVGDMLLFSVPGAHLVKSEETGIALSKMAAVVGDKTTAAAKQVVDVAGAVVEAVDTPAKPAKTKSTPAPSRIPRRSARLSAVHLAETEASSSQATSPAQSQSTPVSTRQQRSRKSNISTDASVYGSVGSNSAVDAPSGEIEPKNDAGEEDDASASDKTYEPTPREAEQADVQGGEGLPEDENGESAALAWALVAVGGLGLGSGAVFGAECMVYGGV